jgi:purine-nucleoside phosphorylase
MNSNFTEKLNTMLHQCYGTDDALKSGFDLPSDGQYDMVVLSPIWNPYDIMKTDEVEIECLKNRNTTSSYLLHYGEQTIAWIRTGAGAGNVVDACLSMVKNNCSKILFLGTCNALKEDLSVGDLVVPNKAISGTGATRYLLDAMDGDPTFLKERRTPPKGILWLSKAAIKVGSKLNTRTVFSTDSLMGALLHLNEIEETGADVVDMEATAFTRCMSLLEKPGVALLTVAGNTGRHSTMARIYPENDPRMKKTQEETLSQIILNLL